VAERISIFDVIKRGGYEASLITTFNATLPFYEEVVLRKLVAAGCRHNVVLMDQAQCAHAWDSEASRPRLAGYEYTLLPIGVPGAFHPKVCLLVGPKKASILVGSHNLTISGFGYNREITNWIDVAGPNDAAGIALLKSVWQMVNQWIEITRGALPEPLLDSALALAHFINPLTVHPAGAPTELVLHQVPGGPTLIDQLAEHATIEIRRIGVVGAFFDSKLMFPKELTRRWPKAEIVVGIDPDSVHLTTVPPAGGVRYVDARQLWPEDEGHSYLHAKAIFLDGGANDKRLFASGSANPSRPAWMGDPTSGNVEAILLRFGKAAKEAADATALNLLFGLPSIDPSVFKAISNRSKAANVESSGDSTAIWAGIADSEAGEIRIAIRGNCDELDRAIFLGPDLNVLEVTDSVVKGDNEIVLRPTIDLVKIRSCALLRRERIVIRAMVQHPFILSSSSRSSRQHQIHLALSSLGSGDGDISKVIASVERVIFSEDTSQEIEVAIQEHRIKMGKAAASQEPATLEINIADTAKRKKKVRLLKSGDLAYLIDIMLRRLSEGLETRSVETDTSGRNEEEQKNTEDEGNEPPPQDIALTDIQVAEAVARRVRKLVRRMTGQLRLATNDEGRRTGAVLQLIAVLALIRELRHLEKQPRWRATGHELAEEGARRTLLDDSISYLLGSTPNLIDITDKAAGENTDEAMQLRVLLMWLAWDLGEELTEQVDRFWDAEQLQSKLCANAVFLKLMPDIMRDESACLELEQSISRTIRPTPVAAIRAETWLVQVTRFGEACASGFTQCDDLRVGGYGYVPGYVDEAQIVAELSSETVGFCSFGMIRRFSRSRVVGLTLAAPGGAAGLR